jgi:hypothetical protein
MLKNSDLISIQIVTRDSLDKGVWPILGPGNPISISEDEFPIADFRMREYVGIKIRDSGIMCDFIAAYHKLTIWDNYFDVFYFDKLLLPNIKRPEGVILKKV